MGKTKVVLNGWGVRALVQSDEMAAVCGERAKIIRDRCGDGYESNARKGKTRVNAIVYAVTHKAKKDNMKNNTILRALK